MPFDFDYLLAGGSGQIGSELVRRLVNQGTLYQVDRTDTRPLPVARHVINAGGYTQFDDKVGRYWNDNIRLAVKLATHAQWTGAQFHQFSSEAVAEYWNGSEETMPESLGAAVAHPKMIDYALSKVLVEKAVLSIVDPERLTIYRTSDVLPSLAFMDRDFRRNHWLSILFATGKAGFEQCDDFPVWLIPVNHLAETFCQVVDLVNRPLVFHLLGHVYLWRTFHAFAADEVLRRNNASWAALVKRVTDVVRIDPPLAECIHQARTTEFLYRLGLRFPKLDAVYWQRFAKYAIDY